MTDIHTSYAADSPLNPDQDSRFMLAALQQAAAAADQDEVPVGAVIVHQGNVIARAHISAIRWPIQPPMPR